MKRKNVLYNKPANTYSYISDTYSVQFYGNAFSVLLKSCGRLSFAVPIITHDNNT